MKFDTLLHTCQPVPEIGGFGNSVDLSRTPMNYGEDDITIGTRSGSDNSRHSAFGAPCRDPESGCGCPPGFFPYYNPFGVNQCVDVNECRHKMCGEGSSCINTIG